MDKEKVEKEKKVIRQISAFVLLLVGLLVIIAITTVGIGYMDNSSATIWWGLLLFLPAIFAVAVYRRLVVRFVREAVEQ